MQKILALTALALAACSSPQPPRETSAAPAETAAPAGTASAPSAPTAASAPAPTEPTAGSAPATPSGAAPAASARAEEPAPSVDVKNIGMHVGGGKNDAAEKAPIKRSVEPHLPAFARCFAKVDDPTKGGDFGVDLRIEREGGKAKVDHPRTALKGEGFKTCVLDVFAAIDFEKPKGGTTTVSYSLRFTPKQK